MEGFTFFRAVQAVAGLGLISIYLRRTFLARQNPQRFHRVDRWFMLAGGVILLILGVWGKLPTLW
jgi:cytochrome c biogenesis protein CcdA